MKTFFYDKSLDCDDKFTLLHSVLELLKLKARNGWSDKSFTDLLVLLKDMLLKANKFSMQHLQSKEAYSSVSIGCAKSTRVSEPLHPIPEGV